MIFYEVEKADGPYLVATQADAKREAREAKCTWAQVDVPTDKQGLMGYINSERRVDQLAIEELQAVIDEEMGVEPETIVFTPPALPTAKVPGPPCVTLISVEEFIQDADGGALASIASNVCWRIKELTKLLS